MKTVIAIDPGTLQSAYVFWCDGVIKQKAILPNEELVIYLRHFLKPENYVLVIEQVRSYGMAIGATTLDTIHWSGRFHEAFEARQGEVVLMPRMDVKMFWCHAAKASDANIWQAMKDRFGEPGKKSAPGFLFGVTSHERAALALAVAFAEQVKA